MSETKSLREAVKQIRDDNKKHFGTKMPGNESKEQEQTLQELSYSQMIMGSLASMIWGVKSKDKDQDIKTLLGRGNTIYDLINNSKNSITSIKDQFKEFNSNLAPAIIKLHVESISKQLSGASTIYDLLVNGFGGVESAIKANTIMNKTQETVSDKDDKDANIIKVILTGIDENILNTALGHIDIQINDPGKLADLIQNIIDLTKDKQKIKEFTALGGFVKLLETLTNTEFIKNLKESDENLKAFSDILSGTDGASIHKILENISELFEGIEGINTDINNFDVAIDSIIKVITLENKNINVRSINALLRLTKKNGSIDQLLKNLDGITKDIKIEWKNINSLSEFFEGIAKIADIGFIQRMRMKSNLKYFSKYITKEIPNILVELNKAKDDIQDKKNYEAMGAIGNFFVSIAQIANISKEDRRQLRSNIIYIKDFIIGSLTDPKDGIIVCLADASNKLTKEGGNALIAINAFIENLMKVLDISLIQLFKLNIKLSFLNDIIESEIISGENSLLVQIKSIQLGNARKNIELLNSLFELMESMYNAMPGFKTILSAGIKLAFIDNITLILIHKLIENINKLPKLSFNKINNILQNLNTTIVAINQLNNISNDAINTINNVNTFLLILESAIQQWQKSKIEKKKINAYFNNIKSILESIQTHIYNPLKTADYNKDDVKKVEDVEKILVALNKISKLSILLKGQKIGLNALEGTADKIKNIIEKFKELDQKDIDKATTAVESFTKLVMMSAAVLLFGAILITKIKIANLIAFTVCLATFLFTISFTFKALAKTIINDIDTAKTACTLIVISGLTLIIGSMLMSIIKPDNLILFTATLALFLFSITATFALMSKLIKNSIYVAREAVELIAVSGLILIIGGLFMKVIKPEELFMFAVTLAGFLLVMSGIFLIFSKINGEAMKATKEAALLVSISGGILILGGLFMKLINPGQLIMFAVTLGVFLLGLVLIFRVAGEGMQRAMKGVIGAVILVTVSAFILMIGALFMKDLNRAVGAVAFAILLGLFVWGIMEVFSKNSKNISRAIPLASAFAIVTAISAFTLLLAGGLLVAYPKLILMIPLFGVLLWGFTLMMSKVLGKLAQNAKRLIIGAKIMAMLGGLIFELSLAFGTLVKVSKMVDNWLALAGTVVIMGVVILGLYVLAKAIASSGAEGVAMMAAATAILAGLIGCIALMGIGIQEIAKGMEEMARVSHMDLDFGNLIKLLLGVMSLAGPLMGLGAMIIPIGLGALSMKAMRSFLLDTAEVIQAYADLKIPIYEGDKITGYMIMSQKDIDQSTKNIKSVVTTLFDTINEIYQKNPEMFKFSLSSLLTGGGGTVFGKVAAAGKGLAVMLSWMAKTVQEWFELKIPIYTGEKITGYKTIDNGAFVKAGENIKAVVTTLAQAVLDVYNNAPDKDMFEPAAFGLFGPSKFSKVCTSLKNMGDMLSVVAEGIETWADLKIPVYKKNSTEISGYITIKNDDFATAAENIKSVVTCLAGAVLDIYDERPELFDAQGWFGLGSSKFSIVCRALGNMGGALGSIANGVKEWTDLKIPVYKGKEVDHYLSLKDGDFTTASKNISKVVSCLAQAIIDVYDANPTMFDSTGFLGMGDSKFAKVVGVIGPMGKTLGDIADAVQSWADLKIPIYGGTDKDGRAMITEYRTLGSGDFTKVAKNIDLVVTSLIRSVASLYEPHKEWFDGSGIFGLGKSPIGKVLGVIPPLGKTLKDIADAVQAWADFKIPVYGGLDKDGRPQISEYKTLGSKDFENATKNINKVVTSLVSSIASLYFDPQAKKEKWFDGGFFSGDSPIAKVLGSIEPLGNVVAGIAEGVTAFAEFKIPIYGIGKDGAAIITGYHTLSDDQIVKAGVNIGRIVKLLAKTIGSLYFDKEAQAGQWFDKANWLSSGTPFSKVMTSLEPMGNMVSSVAEGIKNFADLKVPIYGKNNKGELTIVGYKTLADGDFNTATHNIGKIITTLGMAIGTVVKNNPGVFDSKDSPVKKAAESIKLAGDTLSVVAGVIGAYANGKFPTLKYDSKGKLVPGAMITLDNKNIEEMKKRIKAVITALVQSIVTVYNSSSILKDEKSYKDKLKNTEKIVNHFKGSLSNIINDVKYLTSKNHELTDVDFKNVETAVTNFITCINNIKAVLNGTIKDNSMDIDLSNLVKFGINEKNTLVLHQLVRDASDILDVVNKLLQITNLAKNIDSNTYSSISTGLSTIYGSFSTIILSNKKELDYFVKYLNDFINVIDLIYDYAEFSNKCNSLKDGILNVYTITSIIEQNDIFKQHTATLKDYIQSINSIELNKLNSLTNFVNAMNQLSSRLGNLDNLTDAIANRLSAVLFELVQQLQKADASIKNAHVLQAKRKKLIDEAMKTISDLMDKKMIVEISQAQPDVTEQTDVEAGKVNGNIVKTNASAEEDTTTDLNKARDYKSEESPENTGNKQQPSLSPDKKSFTFDQFKAYMESTYLNKIEERVR